MSAQEALDPVRVRVRCGEHRPSGRGSKRSMELSGRRRRAYEKTASRTFRTAQATADLQLGLLLSVR